MYERQAPNTSVATLLFLCLVLTGMGSRLALADSLESKEIPPSPQEAPLRGLLVDEVFHSLLIDQLEYRVDDGDRFARWDIEGWVGRERDRIWIRTEGNQPTRSRDRGELEAQLLYTHLVSAFWEVQVGLRHQRLYGNGPNRSRTFLSLGFEGSAPYRIDVEPFLFLSNEGRLSARLAATTDWFLTQRLIVQPRFEVQAAAREDRDIEVGSGLNDIELGLRLRYELERELAPYIGISWIRKVGTTADLARREGDRVRSIDFVLGVRFWF